MQKSEENFWEIKSYIKVHQRNTFPNIMEKVNIELSFDYEHLMCMSEHAVCRLLEIKMQVELYLTVGGMIDYSRLVFVCY